MTFQVGWLALRVHALVFRNQVESSAFTNRHINPLARPVKVISDRKYFMYLLHYALNYWSLKLLLFIADRFYMEDLRCIDKKSG